jgi:hypothetical protein
MTVNPTDAWAQEVMAELRKLDAAGGDPIIQCATCTRQTRDPDKWDPEATTGIIYCDHCWPNRPGQ